MTGEPYTLTLAQASAAIKQRSLSPVELLESVLKRVAETEPEINAFATMTEESARAAAKESEAEISAGRYRGPLHGIPLGVKDIFDVDGVATGCGSAVRQGHIASGASRVVSRLQGSGMIVIGKTHTHEFALGGITPEVRNPWNVGHSPGGSSGGSGAAVASGQCLVATGTDTAGSIRIPAAASGVVGLKPTYGLVSRAGITPLSWSFDTAGALTRNVTDAAIVLQAIAGHDSADPASTTAPAVDYTADINSGIDGIRLGVLDGYFRTRVDPRILKAVETAVGVLSELGAGRRDRTAPFAQESLGALRIIDLAEASNYHRRDLHERAALYTPGVRTALEAGLLLPAVDYVQAQRFRLAMTSAWQALFEDSDVLVAPTLPITAPRVGQTDIDWGAEGSELVRTAIVRLTCPVNVVGFPSIAVPIGLTDDGMPMSMQLVGRPFSEGMLLRVARAYEAATVTIGRIAPVTASPTITSDRRE